MIQHLSNRLLAAVVSPSTAWRPGLFAISLLIGPAACREKLVPEFPPIYAIVYGHVRAASLEPIAGAQVTITLYQTGLCGEHVLEQRTATTDVAGRYRLQMSTPAPSQTGCAKVKFQATGFDTDSIVTSDLKFFEGTPSDSLDVSIVLQ